MKKSIDEIANDLGNLVDSMDNILAATSLPMSAEFHLEQVKENMQSWSAKLKKIYTELTDENPWEVKNG